MKLIRQNDYKDESGFLKKTMLENNLNKENFRGILKIILLYSKFFKALSEKNINRCIRFARQLAEDNFADDFVTGKQLPLKRYFQSIEEWFEEMLDKKRQERQKQMDKLKEQHKFLSALDYVAAHLQTTLKDKNEEDFLTHIDNAYIDLCKLAKIDIDNKTKKDRSKGLAKWYDECVKGKALKSDEDRLEVILKIGEKEYIIKKFGLFDTSKRLKLVRKYLPKIKTKWEGFQEQDKDKK